MEGFWDRITQFIKLYCNDFSLQYVIATKKICNKFLQQIFFAIITSNSLDLNTDPFVNQNHESMKRAMVIATTSLACNKRHIYIYKINVRKLSILNTK